MIKMRRLMLPLLSIALLTSCGGSDFQEAKIMNFSDKEIELYEEVQPMAVQQLKLIKRSVLGRKLSILLPDYFSLMAKNIVEIKYPSGNRPTEVYSNEDGGVSVGFSHTENQIELKQLPELMPVFVEQFSNMYPTIKWYKKEMAKVQGVDCILFEFETPAIDTKIYNLMAITVLDGRMMISTFNCTVGVKSEWKGYASQIINSLQISE